MFPHLFISSKKLGMRKNGGFHRIISFRNGPLGLSIATWDHFDPNTKEENLYWRPPWDSLQVGYKGFAYIFSFEKCWCFLLTWGSGEYCWKNLNNVKSNIIWNIYGIYMDGPYIFYPTMLRCYAVKTIRILVEGVRNVSLTSN